MTQDELLQGEHSPSSLPKLSEGANEDQYGAEEEVDAEGDSGEHEGEHMAEEEEDDIDEEVTDVVLEYEDKDIVVDIQTGSDTGMIIPEKLTFAGSLPVAYGDQYSRETSDEVIREVTEPASPEPYYAEEKLKQKLAARQLSPPAVDSTQNSMM